MRKNIGKEIKLSDGSFGVISDVKIKDYIAYYRVFENENYYEYLAKILEKEKAIGISQAIKSCISYINYDNIIEKNNYFEHLS